MTIADHFFIFTQLAKQFINYLQTKRFIVWTNIMPEILWENMISTMEQYFLTLIFLLYIN